MADTTLTKDVELLLNLQLRKSPNVFVGPKYLKNPRGKAYGTSKSKVNAYYAHWAEYGASPYKKTQPGYMRPAYEAKKREVLSILEREAKKVAQKWIRENTVRYGRVR